MKFLNLFDISKDKQVSTAQIPRNTDKK